GRLDELTRRRILVRRRFRQDVRSDAACGFAGVPCEAAGGWKKLPPYFVTFTVSLASCCTVSVPLTTVVARTLRPVRFPGGASSSATRTRRASLLSAGIVTSIALRPLTSGGSTSCTLNSPS